MVQLCFIDYIDECRVAALSNLVICMQDNTECRNTPGDFECICVDGYELMGGACERENYNTENVPIENMRVTFDLILSVKVQTMYAP